MKPIENLQVGDSVLVNKSYKGDKLKVVQIEKRRVNDPNGVAVYQATQNGGLYWNDGENSLCSIRRKVIMKGQK